MAIPCISRQKCCAGYRVCWSPNDARFMKLAAFNKEILDMLRDPELRWQVTKVAQAGACVVEDTSRDAIPDRDSCVKEHGTTPGRDHDDLHTVASQALHDPKMSALVEMAMGTIPSHQSA